MASKGKDIAAVKASGRLFFRPVEARGLKGKKLETYAKVYLDKEKKFKTDRIKNSSDPSWHEDPRLLQLTEDTPVSLVRFAVWKKDLLTRNFLGEFHFSVESLLDGVPRDRWYALESKKGAERGEIHLQVCFLPVSVDMTPERDEFAFPLHTMIRKDQRATFDKVIEHIKSPEADEASKPAVEVTFETQDTKGHTALHVAAQLDKPEYLEALLAAGCNPNSVSKEDGSTPLHLAAMSGSSTCLNLLLGAGAQINATDLAGLTPMHVAAGSGRAQIITELADRGADVSPQDKTGDTPMHHALKANQLDSIRALASKGADIFKENTNRVSSAALCTMLDFVDEKTTEAFLEAVGVVTPREFQLKKLYSHRYVLSGSGISKDWLENPQFGFFLKTEGKTTLSCLMHFEDGSQAQPMEKAGYMVIRPKRGEFNEVTFLHDVVGYGTKDPLEVVLEATDTTAIFLPYTKGDTLAGKWTIVAYADCADVGIEERKPYKEHIKIDSEWAGASAAGCVENENWTANPKFKLSIPAEQVPVTILLEQERSLQDTAQFQVMPYKSHIGFYLYNDELEILVGQVQRFKNARQVSEQLVLDGTARRDYLLVPCTYRAGEEIKFTLHVFANVAVQLTPE